MTAQLPVDAGKLDSRAGINAVVSFFTFAERNQLIATEKHATDGGTLLAKVLCKYDALGDRIERDEDAEI